MYIFLWGWLVFPERYAAAFFLEENCGKQNWLPLFWKLNRQKRSHYKLDTVTPSHTQPQISRRTEGPLVARMLLSITPFNCELSSGIAWWKRTTSNKVIFPSHNSHSHRFSAWSTSRYKNPANMIAPVQDKSQWPSQFEMSVGLAKEFFKNKSQPSFSLCTVLLASFFPSLPQAFIP